MPQIFDHSILALQDELFADALLIAHSGLLARPPLI